jgi:hypothetical protein
MTRLKHVLILIILILPMFALAPSLVASPNVTLASQEKVDSSLPAQFVEETLRVAVYVESNLTLPAYATGGVYTANYQNVIDLLEAAGYTVTAISTQDILDRKLRVVDFDAFVLPNQLPRESIINHIKDYWLGGGGVLSFGASAGYLFYAGIIDPSEEGEFNLYPIDGNGLWTYAGLTGFELYDGIYLNQRNPVTKSLEQDIVYPYSGNDTLLGGFSLVPLLGARYLELGYQDGYQSYTAIAGFDNPDLGGRIVSLPGNCSSFETWIEPVISDAIDWITPRPKARIAIDFTHVPYYGVDSWDENVSHVPRYNIFRNFLVNHSFTFDKIYPKDSAGLTAGDLAPYDVVIFDVPSINYTATEISIIKTWVQNGGSLFILGDWITPTGQENLNLLMSDWGLALDRITPNMGSFITTEFELHPVIEGISSLSIAGGRWVNVSGSAYSIVKSGPDIAIGGVEPGDGRVILSGDINFLDYFTIGDEDNAQFGVNVINWLSAAKADVLVYTDGGSMIDPNFNYYRSSIANALNGLGIRFMMTNDRDYFNLSLQIDTWKLVISDANSLAPATSHPLLIDHLENGGKLIMRDFMFRYTGYPLWNYIGWEGNQTVITTAPPSVYLWESGNSIFNLPVNYGENVINSSTNYFNTDFTHVMLFDNATALAGITASPMENMSAIVLGANGNAICNMFAISEYDEDTDNSTYPDNFELLTNEIGYLYFDRPTIDHPADVTYMETETGNEITWTPTADAGPWNYVFRVNGTPVESSSWTGAPLTFNVDGVNISITEYQLTVFDRLGYSVSDTVTLNVTEYVAPTPPPFGIDPLLLLVIGGAIAGVVIILIVFTKMKKQK